MLVHIFTVMPSRVLFYTSDLALRRHGNAVGDTNSAYFCAHRLAAQVAAQSMISAYVLRDDRGDRHCGFGAEAMTMSSSILHKIASMGFASVWDYTSASWVPLPFEVNQVCERVRDELPVPLQ